MQVEVTIDAVGTHGDGIGRIGDRRVAVPGAAPGDRVRVRVDPRDAKESTGTVSGEMVTLLEAGPARRAPDCAHFGSCGGCAAQHLAAAVYEGWKLDLLVAALARQGFDRPAFDPMVCVPPGARRRARLAALRTTRGVLLGFAGRQSRRLVDLIMCPVLSPRLEALLPPLRDFAKTIVGPGMRFDMELLEIDGMIDLGIVGGPEPGLAVGEAAAAFAAAHRLARMSWRSGDHEVPMPLVERQPVQVRFGGVLVAVPPGAFLQGTAAGEAALRRFVLETTVGRVGELFCGLGTFTLPLAAAGMSIAAWEGAADAVDALRKAVAGRSLPVTAERRDLAKRPLSAKELKRFDTILLDPPRAGAREQMPAIASSGVGRVIYVSCNPVSFARDARLLADAGYRIERILPVDQFLWSPHLELAALLVR